MIRGMPDDLQVNLVSLPCPPASWSARLASKMAWYSGVSGACCPRLRGLLGSHWVPPILCHWPAKSGYSVSSIARAAPVVMINAAASVIEPTEIRLRTACLPATIVDLPVTHGTGYKVGEAVGRAKRPDIFARYVFRVATISGYQRTLRDLSIGERPYALKTRGYDRRQATITGRPSFGSSRWSPERSSFLCTLRWSGLSRTNDARCERAVLSFK